MDRSLQLVSEYTASLSYEDLPASTIRAVKHKLIDSIGCALCAYLWEPSKISRRLCYPAQGPLTARVIGSLQRTTLDMAAFANGTMIRAAEFNDTYRFKGAAHPSDALAAVLAAAEAIHSDGKGLITGIVAAYEMAACFIDTMLTREEWDNVALSATFGAALGAGKMLGLSKEQLGHCVALALVPNMTLAMRRSGEVSMYKDVYAGMACRQGVFAALMAQEGMTGPGEAIEGETGLRVVTDTIGFGPFGGDGRQFVVERTVLKTFPVRDGMQMAVAAALELREQVSTDEIESIHVTTYPAALEARKEVPVEQWAPKTRGTADHSLPFALAVAFIDGDVTPECLSRERFLDQDVLAMMRRMRVDTDAEFERQAPAKRNLRIEIRTRSGDSKVVHKVVTAEELQTPWTDQQVEGKFLKIVRDVLTPAQARASLQLMWQLEEVEDVAQLLDGLRI